MSEDKRVWMYRKGEARLFNSPEAVPANEGWKDAPISGDLEPASKRKMTRDKFVKLDGENGDNA